MPKPPNLHIFGLWVETGAPGGNPCRPEWDDWAQPFGCWRFGAAIWVPADFAPVHLATDVWAPKRQQIDPSSLKNEMLESLSWSGSVDGERNKS